MVFASGLTMLAIELAGSRLLAPFFGSSLLVWANLIGLILLAQALGNLVGGRWADRDPRDTTLAYILLGAGTATALLPMAAGPVLAIAVPALEFLDAAAGLGSFLGALALLAVPVILFGMVTPFAARLASRQVAATGTIVGRLQALSAGGAIFGVFIPVFVLIPLLGTRLTFTVLGGANLALAILVLVRARAMRRKEYIALLALLALGSSLVAAGGRVKDQSGLLFERESMYNFVQVYERDGVRWLTVNEGLAQQSLLRLDGSRSGGIWDFFLAAPLFRTGNVVSDPPRKVLILGLAAGTIAREYTEVYGPVPIDGVEIDPEIVSAGQRHFQMNEPNLHVAVADARAFLHRSAERYDLIALDAYSQPYIPFHLATVEFMRDVRGHLAPGGVVALNAARTAHDFRLVDTLAATMRAVFPAVYALDHPTDGNTLLIGTDAPEPLANYRSNLAAAPAGLAEIVAGVTPSLMERSGTVLTDDRAPVENLIHSILFDYALGK